MKIMGKDLLVVVLAETTLYSGRKTFADINVYRQYKNEK